MGFLTDVNDDIKKTRLLNALKADQKSLVIIEASGSNGNLEPLKKLYADRENVESNKDISSRLMIDETFSGDINESYNATLILTRHYK